MITLPEIIERDKRPPSVTVYMICYNHEKYLDEAMHGVLMQKTDFPVNIVIHDDASTDKSAEIIRRYASENPNITAILEETNFYQNGKSFFLIVLPYFTGKYVAWCECDDFWIDEHKLQEQINYLESNPDCIAVYSNTLPVNKFSQYDESVRTFITLSRPEGDYSRHKILGTIGQLASFVSRNFWKFMTREEIDFYTHVKANGDEKIIAMCLRLGRVHHFSREFAAHRKVIDEGDSWSARMARLDKYECCRLSVKQKPELYRMLAYFFGRDYKRRYVDIMFDELISRVRFHKSIIKDAELDSCYQLKNIPIYAYVAFPFYFMYRVLRKIAKTLQPNKF